MNNNYNQIKRTSWLKKLAIAATVVGVGTLVSSPILAGRFPERYTLFSRITTTRGYCDCDVITALKGHAKFDNLVAELEAAGLEDVLANEELTFTIFAPTDEAFEKLSSQEFEQFKDSREQILKSHVIIGEISKGQVEQSDSVTVPTLNNGEITISFSENNTVKLNDIANAEYPSSFAKNGTIIGIDSVIMPGN